MLSSDKTLHIEQHIIEEAAKLVPKLDFCDGAFDVVNENKLREIIVIVSTPRSGSTYFCDLLRVSGVCLAHEYFQPHQYLPLLADRWQCIESGELNEQKYVQKLVRYRTLENGILGINIHGSHFPFFLRMKKYLGDVPIKYIYLKRRNKFSQAISYAIAKTEKKWSAHFDTASEMEYDFFKILDCLNIIQHQNNINSCFFLNHDTSYLDVIYEDFILSPFDFLKSSGLIENHIEPPEKSLSVQRQSSSRNKEWLERFTREYIELAPSPMSVRKKSSEEVNIFQKVLGFFGRKN